MRPSDKLRSDILRSASEAGKCQESVRPSFFPGLHSAAVRIPARRYKGSDRPNLRGEEGERSGPGGRVAFDPRGDTHCATTTTAPSRTRNGGSCATSFRPVRGNSIWIPCPTRWHSSWSTRRFDHGRMVRRRGVLDCLRPFDVRRSALGRSAGDDRLHSKDFRSASGRGGPRYLLRRRPAHDRTRRPRFRP